MKNRTAISSRDKLIVLFSALFFSHGSSFISFYTPAAIWAGIVIVLFILLYFACLRYVRPLLYLFPLIILHISTTLFKSSDLDSFASVARVVSNVLQVSILPLLSLYLIKSSNEKPIFWIFLFYFIVEATTGISTIFAYKIDPDLVRMNYGLYRDLDPALYAFRMRLNVGDYHMTYGYSAMIPIVILMIKWRKSFAHPFLIGTSCLILLSFMIYVIYISQYTISFVVGVFLLLLLFLKKRMTRSYFIITLLSTALLLFLLGVFIPPILHSVANTIDSEIMATRLDEVASSIEGKASMDLDSDYYLRMKSYNKSIESIKQYSIIGAWNDSASGGHSFIFDNIARMGLIGFVSIVLLLYLVHKRHLLFLSSQPWIYYYYYAFLAILIFYVFNPDGMYEQVFFAYPVSGLIIRSHMKTV